MSTQVWEYLFVAVMIVGLCKIVDGLMRGFVNVEDEDEDEGDYGFMSFYEIEHDSRSVKLHGLLEAKFYEDEHGIFHAESPELGIFACGATHKAVKADFQAQFMATWEGLRCEDHESLTPDARELRARLCNLIVG